MIRYYISPSRWRDRVDQVSPSWRTKAAERTARFRELGRYDEEGRDSIWSRIKRVHMELQHFKCGFCERRLEESAYGNIEHDVEHFRPKSEVEDWPSEAQREERAEQLLALHVALAGVDDPDETTAAAAQLMVDRLTDEASPHANCSGRHLELARADPEDANEVAGAVLESLAGVAG